MSSTATPSPVIQVPASVRGLPSKDKKAKKASLANSRVRFPCLSRGMGKAHNHKTAYIVIPTNVRHGDELSCSLPCCSHKFRYCSTCKKPVARRNFRNRHAHSKKRTSKAKEDMAFFSSSSSSSGEEYCTPIGSHLNTVWNNLQLSVPPPPNANKVFMDPSKYAGITDAIAFPVLNGEESHFSLIPRFLMNKDSMFEFCK